MVLFSPVNLPNLQFSRIITFCGELNEKKNVLGPQFMIRIGMINTNHIKNGEKEYGKIYIKTGKEPWGKIDFDNEVYIALNHDIVI